MNDSDIATAVRDSLRRNAERAPSATGLAAAVRRRRRGRNLRNWIAGGISGLCVLALALVVPAVLTQPSARPMPEPDGVDICLAVPGSDATLPVLIVSERYDGETDETEVKEPGSDPMVVEHPVWQGQFSVKLQVFKRGQPQLELDDKSHTTGEGLEWIVGVDPDDQTPMADLDGDADGPDLWVEPVDRDVNDAELGAWVQSVTLHYSLEPCLE